MSIFLRPSSLKIKDANGNYIGTDIFMQTSTQDEMNGNNILPNENVPSAPNATGERGTIRFDTDYMYICVADNTWKRIPLETWA